MPPTTQKSAGYVHLRLRSTCSTNNIPAHLWSFSGSPANDQASALKRAISRAGQRKSLPRTKVVRRQRFEDIIEGRQGRELGDGIRRNRPGWLPWPSIPIADQSAALGLVGEGKGRSSVCPSGPRRLFRDKCLSSLHRLSLQRFWRRSMLGGALKAPTFAPEMRREPTRSSSPSTASRVAGPHGMVHDVRLGLLPVVWSHTGWAA